VHFHFVKPTGTSAGHTGALTITQTNVSGNVYSFTVVTQDTALVMSSGPVSVYVFVPGAASSSSYGINAFDAAGVCTFSTNDRLLKIAGYYVTTYHNSTATSPTPATLEYGSVPSQYAICLPVLGIRIQTLVPGTSTVRRQGAYIDSSNLLQYTQVSVVTVLTEVVTARQSIVGSIYVPIIDSTLYD